MDSVVLTVGDVKPSGGIGFHPIAGRAFVALVDHRGGHGAVVEVAVEQCLNRHTPPPPAQQRTVVESLAVSADGDAVGTYRQRTGRAVRAAVQELPTLHDHPEATR